MRTVQVRKLALIAVALTTLTASAVLSPTTAAEDPRAVGGQWSSPFWEGTGHYDPPSLEKSKAHPTAVTAVGLPDGRVLYWNGLEGAENADIAYGDTDLHFTFENSRARILDLRSGTPAWTKPTYERGVTDEAQDQPHSTTHDLFCADQKLLWDGTLLIAGGMEARYSPTYDVYGDDETRIFDPKTNTFTSAAPMNERRWYPGMVTLPNGRVLVTSGVRQLIFSPLNPEPSFSQVRLSEIYDPTSKTWSKAGVSDWSLPLFPRIHLLPDGKVFYGGAAQSWDPLGETADMATWAMQRLYDPATQKWSLVGPTRYGVRNGGSSVLLRLEAPYDKASILLAGGTAGPPPTTGVATTLSEIVRWSPENGLQNEERPKSPLAGLAGDQTQLRNQRWYSTPVMLPTGEVLLMNGGDMDDLVDPGSSAAVRTPELYDPKTGTWRELAPGSRDRVYHNSAVLLRDGSILVGGHAPVPAHYYQHNNTVTRSNNFRDSTFEIYKPPYMFRGARPVISAVKPMSQGRSIKLNIEAGEGGAAKDISEVVLVRMTATTHTIDGDMRAVKLEHEVLGSNLLAELPKGGDGRLLPPGPYYVFAIRNTPDGPVPSIGETVLIQPEAEGKVIAKTP